jgi:WD40 repeat protein
VTVAFSPDNRFLAVGGSTEIRLHETGSWRRLHSFPRLPAGQLAPSFAFTRDARLCAVALPPNRLLLIDPMAGDEIAMLPAEAHVLCRVAFSPDERFLAVSSTDHHVLIWDLEKLRAKLEELGLNWR